MSSVINNIKNSSTLLIPCPVSKTSLFALAASGIALYYIQPETASAQIGTVMGSVAGAYTVTYLAKESLCWTKNKITNIFFDLMCWKIRKECEKRGAVYQENGDVIFPAAMINHMHEELTRADSLSKNN